MAVIETKNLFKTYNDKSEIPVHAINDVSISVNKGDFIAIVGPSGCGKTTLLNMIGGIDQPTSGNININEINLNSLSSAEITDFRLANIGFVFQSYNLIPVLTAIENVEFILELQGQSKTERRQRAMELLEFMGIGDRANYKPSELSGGQQQRVAVARAIASKPKFVLADEPTANLDSKSTSNLLDLMLKMNEKESITFIFSTHDDRVMKRAKRLIYMEDGKVIKDEIK
jgi:putative ABC transport system ATP-binding protein